MSDDETVQELQDTLDELKDLWQRGETMEMPGPIERARALAAGLESGDEGSPVEQGSRGHVLVSETVDYELIETRIREDATNRFSPLPDGTAVDPDGWDIEYWVIEDICVHYRVDHPDSTVKSEVDEFAV